MPMPKDSGLEVLEGIVRRSMKYYSDAFRTLNTRLNNTYGTVGKTAIRLPSLDSVRDSVGKALKGLNNSVSQLTGKSERTNYIAVVSSFLPPGARLLKPQYPEGSNEIQFADLDGDNSSELITSYKTGDGIRTMILKKDEIQWYKLDEIYCPNCEGIHYRNSADMAGDGRNLLLLGLSAQDGARNVYAYSIENGNAKKIFNKKYNLLELKKPQGRYSTESRASLALWNEESPEIYDIELVGWNGLELEQRDSTEYLEGKVVPYYVRKLRQNPNDTVSWYNLANTMAKSGNKANAASVIRLGLDRNPDQALREKFNMLNSRL